MAHSSLESNPRLAGRPSRTDSLKPCHQISKDSPKAPLESNVVEARPGGGGDTGGLPKSSRALKVRREGAPEEHPRSTGGAHEEHTRSTREAHEKHTRSTREAHEKHTRSTREAHEKHRRSTRGAHEEHTRASRLQPA